MQNHKVEKEEVSRWGFKAEFPYYRWLLVSALKRPPSVEVIEQSTTYCLAADLEDFLHRRLNGASRLFTVTWNGRPGLCIYLSITDEEYWLVGCNESPDDKQTFIDELQRLIDENLSDPAKCERASKQLIESRPQPATLYY